MKKHFWWALLLIISFSCSKFNQVRKSKDPMEKYEAAIKYFEEKEYDKCVVLLEEVEPLLRGKKEGEKGQFTIARAYYETKQYEMASFSFKSFYETYPRSEWAEEALYYHAYSLYNESPESELDQTPTLSAIQSIQSYLNTYPQSKRVEESNSIIRELRKKLEVKAYQNALFFYNAKNYKSAIQALGNFEKDYPDSDFMEEVSFKKLETSYEMAMQSVMSKQTARLKETISFYEEFKAKFPNTTYSKEVENIYASSQKKIEEIKNLDKKDN